jgi:lipoyl(octanoyl) transferase|tara:strand:+ start:1291 stop:1944 length:654 start_codon:yes stop_codon:yes gene_type:complete
MKNYIEIKKTINAILYEDAIDFMENRVRQIHELTKKEMLWFLNHSNIYTCGASAQSDEFLSKIDIPVIKTSRGGKTTYHGPGQRVVYFMLNLTKRQKDIRKFITLIENSVIILLKDLNIEAKNFPERVGIWVTRSNGVTLNKEKKIAAIGLRIKKWVTYHGMSFNIDPDLSYYQKINACGLTDYENTSLEQLNIKLTNEEFDKKFEKIFKNQLTNFN